MAADKLLKEKSQVKELLSKVESSYRTAVITEKKYNEMKTRLLRKLDDIESKIVGNEANSNQVAETAEKQKTEEIQKENIAVIEEKDVHDNSETEKPKKARKPRIKKPQALQETDIKEMPPKAEAEEKEEKDERENREEKSAEKLEERPEMKDGKMEKKDEIPKDAEPKLDSQVPEVKKEKKESRDDNAAGDFTAEAAQQFGPQEEVKDIEADKPKEDTKLEIEKLKVLVEGMRDEKKAVQESLQNISESMGELRSMIFQSEGLAKELEMKVEKISEEISEIKPSEIAKRLRKFDENFEKFQIYTEKSDAKFEDLSKKINNAYEMLKSAGGIENLSDLNKQIGRKLEDFNEAMKYVERLASKTEKAFIEVNKNLEDFHVYKARQDNLEEAFKDMMKALDDINMKLDESATKKDFSSFSGEQMVLSKQMEEVMRMVPMLKVKIPEPIQNLTKEREEIRAMLDMLVGQQASGTINQAEYDKLKKANEAKLKKIEESIDTEWKKLEKLLESGEGIDEIGGPLPLPIEPVSPPVSNQADANTEQKTVTTEKASANEIPSQQAKAEPSSNQEKQNLTASKRAKVKQNHKYLL